MLRSKPVGLNKSQGDIEMGTGFHVTGLSVRSKHMLRISILPILLFALALSCQNSPALPDVDYRTT